MNFFFFFFNFNTNIRCNRFLNVRKILSRTFFTKFMFVRILHESEYNFLSNKNPRGGTNAYALTLVRTLNYKFLSRLLSQIN